MKNTLQHPGTICQLIFVLAKRYLVIWQKVSKHLIWMCPYLSFNALHILNSAEFVNFFFNSNHFSRKFQSSSAQNHYNWQLPHLVFLLLYLKLNIGSFDDIVIRLLNDIVVSKTKNVAKSKTVFTENSHYKTLSRLNSTTTRLYDSLLVFSTKHINKCLLMRAALFRKTFYITLCNTIHYNS